MQKRHAALGMFAVLLFSYVINAIDRQLFSVLAADVRNALDLSLPQVGLASTVFTLGMGVAGIPTGYLLGKMSRKSVTLVGLVIFSAATYLTAYARPARPAGLPIRLGPGRGHATDRPAGHRHELFLPAPRGRRQLAELHLRHRRHHRPQPGRRHPRRHALENALHRVRPVRHRRLRADRAAGQALVQRSASATRSGRAPFRRAGRSRAGQPVGPDAAHAAVATAFAGLSIYGYLGLYPTYLRDALGFTPKQAAARSLLRPGRPAVAAGRLAGRPLRLPQAAVLLAADLRRGRRPAVHRARPFPGAARDAVICLRRGHQRHGLRQSVGGHHQVGQQRQGRAGFGLSWQASTSRPLSRATCSAI